MNFIAKFRKKKVEWYDRERLPALEFALKAALDKRANIENHLSQPLTPMSEFFLECPYYNFYTLGVDFPKEVDLFLARLVEKIIKEKYKVHNKEMMEYLKSEIGNRSYYTDIYGYLHKHVGFNYKSYTSVKGEFTDYISTGNYFIEDSRGVRMVLAIIQQTVLGDGPRSQGLKINMFVNGTVDSARKTCVDFIDTINKELGVKMKGSSYAMGAKGYPIKIEPVSWEDLKIPVVLKKEIKFHIMDFIENLNRFKEAGVRPSRGIIIAGSPGNGKTMLGKILCSNINVPFFYSSASDFALGYGQPKIDELYRTAAAYAPSIVLIEDADIFLQQRQVNPNGGSLTSFLNIIDGLKENDGIITILTCNNPELIDEAIKNRPKRFDVIIEFPDPAQEQRIEILNAKLEKHMAGLVIEDLEYAAEKMEGFSGAHLTEFADRLILSKVYANKKIIDREMINQELENFGFRKSEDARIGIR